MGCGSNNTSTIALTPKPFNSPSHSNDKAFSSKSLVVLAKKGNINDLYTIGKVIGRGAYGEVSIGKDKILGIERAIKRINKSLIDTQDGTVDIMNEFNLLKALDHPNVMKIYEAYEDEWYIYLVTELLKGGEIFEKLIEKKQFSENRCALIMKQILQGLAYCHEKKIVHRDIKHQNILLESKGEEWFVKLIDFGFANLYSNSTYFKELHGTPLYMAPELVNEKKFNHKVDIWSCGIVMLMMLTGRLPFKVENNVNAIFASITSYAPSFKDLSCYNYLSHSSIDFLLHCLQQNPNNRSEAITLLEHDWIKSNAPDIEVPHNIANEIAVNLWKFSAQFKLEQAAYTYLATYVASAEDEKKLRQMFLNLDQNKDGLISKEEFITGMTKAKTKISFTDNDLLNMFSEMDADLSGNIDYTEFLRAAMNKTKMLTEKNLKAAFNFFDQDHDGCISKEEIQLVFAKGNVILEDDICAMMLNEINCNNNSSITFKEFKAMMLRGTLKKI